MAEVRQTVGPLEIIREDQIKEVIVCGDVAGVSVGQAMSTLTNASRELQVPVGYEISFGGQAR